MVIHRTRMTSNTIPIVERLVKIGFLILLIIQDGKEGRKRSSERDVKFVLRLCTEKMMQYAKRRSQNQQIT